MANLTLSSVRLLSVRTYIHPPHPKFAIRKILWWEGCSPCPVIKFQSLLFVYCQNLKWLQSITYIHPATVYNIRRVIISFMFHHMYKDIFLYPNFLYFYHRKFYLFLLRVRVLGIRWWRRREKENNINANWRTPTESMIK